MKKRIMSGLLLLAAFLQITAFAATTAGDITKTAQYGEDVSFTADDFIDNFSANEGSDLARIIIDSLPDSDAGKLMLSGTDGDVDVDIAEEIAVDDLADLKFITESGYHGTTTFDWTGVSSDEEEASAKVSITINPEATLQILPYADMLTHWGAVSAGRLAIENIVKGDKIQNKYYFRPDENVTRGVFCLWMSSLLNLQPTANTDTVFHDDVPSWLGGVVNALMEENIIDGSLEDGKLYLHADDTLTRAEAFKMIHKALGLVEPAATDTTLPYNDIDSVPDWAMLAVKTLSDYKIIQGDNYGNLKPNAFMTRAEAAELLYKAYKELPTQ